MNVTANNDAPWPDEKWGVQELSFYDSSGSRLPVDKTRASAEKEETGYEASKAFDEVSDGDEGHYEGAFPIEDTRGWLQYKFSGPVEVASYKVRRIKDSEASYAAGASPKTWTMMRSDDDGTTWKAVDNRSNEVNWVDGEERTFTIVSQQTTTTTTMETYTLKWVAYEDGAFNQTGEIQYKGPSGSEFYVGDFRTDGCIGSADAPDGPVKHITEYCSDLHGLNTLVVRRSNSTDIVGAMICCNNQSRLIDVTGSGTIRNFTSNGGH